MSNVTRFDYCQFLLSSQIHYTLTYCAEHADQFSHDAVNRYLRGKKLTARVLREHVYAQVVRSEPG